MAIVPSTPSTMEGGSSMNSTSARSLSPSDMDFEQLSDTLGPVESEANDEDNMVIDSPI
jgi:hypothetical protein